MSERPHASIVCFKSQWPVMPQNLHNILRHTSPALSGTLMELASHHKSTSIFVTPSVNKNWSLTLCLPPPLIRPSGASPPFFLRGEGLVGTEWLMLGFELPPRPSRGESWSEGWRRVVITTSPPPGRSHPHQQSGRRLYPDPVSAKRRRLVPAILYRQLPEGR